MVKILPDALLDHLIVCNRFGFRSKPLFYCVKDALMRQYGTFDGYDHQHYWKYKHYWAQFYHYDMQWTYNEATPPQVWKHHLYDVWAKDRGDPNDYFETSEDDGDMRIIHSDDAMVRCVSEHRHILERWILQGETRRCVMHKPIDEFFYRAFKTDRHAELIKHSPRFFEYAAQCKGQMATVGDEKQIDGADPFADFKLIVGWLRGEQPTLYDALRTNLKGA